MTNHTSLLSSILAASLCSALFLSPLQASAQVAKPKKVRAFYDPSKDKIIVSWRTSSDVESYDIIFVDSEGEKVFKKKGRGKRKRIANKNLDSGAQYTVKVRARSGGRTSKFTKKSYVHELTRASGKGALLTENSAGRSGSYYLPKGFKNKPLPIMLAFHGQGGAGKSMVNAFTTLARKNKFIIVAPSSRFSPEGIATWEISTTPNEFTEDFDHALDCIEEIKTFEGVELLTGSFLAIGYSAGASVAPYVSTYRSEFNGFAILHGGMFINGFGTEKHAAWLSTGVNDTLRPPAELQGYATSLTNASFPSVRFETYDTDHGLIQTELQDVVAWWLGL